MVMTNKRSNLSTKTFCKNFIFIAISLILIQFFTGCAYVRGIIEGGMAYMENPSMELVLDRLNTAACVSMTAKAVLNDIPISRDSKWPEEMESFPSNQLSEIIRVLAMDRAYSDNGGKISPIKAHLVQVQTILYDVPPDLYAKQGDCYHVGEETFINNYYYKILSDGKFIKKASPSSSEMDAALANAIKQFLDFSEPVCDHTTFYKRKGKYKEALVNKIASENGYKNITHAIISVLEGYNARDISDLRSSLNEIKSVKEDIRQINTLTMTLENKKTLIKNKENVPGYNSVDQIDSDLSVKQKELTGKKERLEELQQMVNKSFENIQNNLPIVSEDDLEMLEKISAACKAVNGLLIDSFTLTTIALLKTPTSVMGIRNELKRMNAQKATNPFIPIRIARLKANTGNVIGNIRTIVYVLKNERSMVGLIKSTADQIIKVTRKSIDNQEVLPEKAPIEDTVDEAIVLADTESATEAKPISVEPQAYKDEQFTDATSSEEIPAPIDMASSKEPSAPIDMASSEEIDADSTVAIKESTEDMIKAETKIETPEIVPEESVESVPPKTIVTKVEKSFTSDIAKTETFPESPQTDVAQQMESAQQLIETLLSDWSRAWSSQNITAYLACYAKDFMPTSGKSKKQWERTRRKRLQKKGIHVEISNIDIQIVNDNKARVTFIQAYQSKTYRDRVLKQLSLKREAGQWKIQKEKQLKVLSR
jgi:hypothetical protein